MLSQCSVLCDEQLNSMFLVWTSRSKSVCHAMSDLDEERGKKIARLENTEKDWELVDKKTTQFNYPDVCDEDAFALLTLRGPVTFLTLFLTFIGEDLLRAIWDNGFDEHGWQYRDDAAINSGNFNRKLLLKFLACCIHIQGNIGKVCVCMYVCLYILRCNGAGGAVLLVMCAYLRCGAAGCCVVASYHYYYALIWLCTYNCYI